MTIPGMRGAGRLGAEMGTLILTVHNHPRVAQMRHHIMSSPLMQRTAKVAPPLLGIAVLLFTAYHLNLTNETVRQLIFLLLFTWSML